MESSNLDFPVVLTPEAINQVKRLLAKDGRSPLLLRIGVKGGGCSGFEYLTRFETESRESDLITLVEGITVICDPKSAKFLKGSTLHYTGNLIGGGFQFENPNASRSCGCGTSFTPKGM